MVPLRSLPALERIESMHRVVRLGEALDDLDLLRFTVSHVRARAGNNTYNIGHKSVHHNGGHGLPDDHTEDLNVLQIGRKLVVGDNPALGTEQNLHPFLLHGGIFLLELIREAEGNNWQPRGVAL